MDQDKKQKIFLAVLGVAVLGAGGYYVFLRDSGPGARTSGQAQKVERRKADTTGETVQRKPQRSKRAGAKKAGPQKIVRKKASKRGERKATERRRSSRGKKAKEKKKKASPAA